MLGNYNFSNLYFYCEGTTFAQEPSSSFHSALYASCYPNGLLRGAGYFYGLIISLAHFFLAIATFLKCSGTLAQEKFKGSLNTKELVNNIFEYPAEYTYKS